MRQKHPVLCSDGSTRRDFVKPGDVADLGVMLTRQKPSAWSFEVEARPFGETW